MRCVYAHDMNRRLRVSSHDLGRIHHVHTTTLRDAVDARMCDEAHSHSTRLHTSIAHGAHVSNIQGCMHENASCMHETCCTTTDACCIATCSMLHMLATRVASTCNIHASHDVHPCCTCTVMRCDACCMYTYRCMTIALERQHTCISEIHTDMPCTTNAFHEAAMDVQQRYTITYSLNRYNASHAYESHDD